MVEAVVLIWGYLTAGLIAFGLTLYLFLWVLEGLGRTHRALHWLTYNPDGTSKWKLLRQDFRWILGTNLLYATIKLLPEMSPSTLQAFSSVVYAVQNDPIFERVYGDDWIKRNLPPHDH